MSTLIISTLFFLSIAITIVFLEFLNHRQILTSETTRKILHVATGIFLFSAFYVIKSPVPFLVIAVLFLVVNSISLISGRLKSIHGARKKNLGPVFYPLAFIILIIFFWPDFKSIIMLSMLILSLVDPMAAMIGKICKSPHRFTLGSEQKSGEGTLAFFITAFLLIILILPRIDSIDALQLPLGRIFWIALITALMGAVFEAFSSHGSDNLTVPAGTALFLHFMITQPVSGQIQMSIGIVLAIGIGLFSIKAKFLNPSGSMGAFLLGTIIFGFGGWAWTLPILIFFFSSSLLSKLGRKTKQNLQSTYEKTGNRDFWQVIANGGLPGLFVLLDYLNPDPLHYILFLVSVAAVNADTWATEIGVFSRFRPRRITDFKVVTHGTSGGITPLGLAASLLGSGLIVSVGFIINGLFSFRLSAVMICCGFLASLIDSILGATLQAQYQCPACQKTTERKTHCNGMKTKKISGLGWMNNDWVNVLSAGITTGGVFIYMII